MRHPLAAFLWLVGHLLKLLTGDAVNLDKCLPAVLLLVVEPVLLVDLADQRAGVVDGAQPGLVIVVTASAVTPVKKLRFWRE